MDKKIPKSKLFQLIVSCLLVSSSVWAEGSDEPPTQTDVDMAVIGAHHEAMSLQDQIDSLRNRVAVLEGRLPAARHYTAREIDQIRVEEKFDACADQCWALCKTDHCHGDEPGQTKIALDCLKSKCDPIRAPTPSK